MKLIELNWSPTDRQLRQFGGVCMVMLPALGWIWGGSTPAILGLCILGLTLAVAALSHPTSIKPIFLTLMVITSPIGLVVGELSMIMIYFGLFLPLSLAFRVTGRDALQLKRLKSSSSYWQEKRQPASASNYYRQS
jgi:hypothetical protein